MLVTLLEAYSNAYIALRSKYPNLYIICISIIVTLWFQGMSRLIEKMFPDKSNYTNMLLMLVPALLLYFGDGRLDEIYNFENLPSRITSITKTLVDKDTRSIKRIGMY